MIGTFDNTFDSSFGFQRILLFFRRASDAHLYLHRSRRLPSPRGESQHNPTKETTITTATIKDTMSWSREDREKPRLNDGVITTLEHARAAQEAKDKTHPTSGAAAVTSKDWVRFYEDDELPINMAFEQVFQEAPVKDFAYDVADIPSPSAEYVNEFNNIFFSQPPATHKPQERISTELLDDPSREAPSLVETPPIPETPKKKRRSRKAQEPEVHTYIDEPTEIDVILGRGGKSNHHPGNKRYREEVLNMQAWYKQSVKTEKTDLAQQVVDYINSYGGRFVKKNKIDGRWFIVANLVARKKASQALREHLSAEERAQAKIDKSNMEST